MTSQLMHHNIAATSNQSVYENQTQTFLVNPVKRSKSESMIDNLVYYLTNREVNGRRIYLCKNIMGIKYVVWNFQIIFWDESIILDRIKSDVYFQTRKNMTDMAIKSALQIISGQKEFWTHDTQEKRTIPTRCISLYKGHFIYFFNSQYYVSNISHNSYSSDIIGVFASKNFDIIQTPKDTGFLNNVYYANNQLHGVDLYLIKDTLCNKLNISEDYFLIILAWLVQSIASDNYTLLELIGESKSGKSYTQSFMRELIDPNLELLTQMPKKIKDLEKETMNGHVMSFDNVDKLDDDMQLFMVELMSANGAKINYRIENKKNSVENFVRRPIILNSVIPVITHEKLQSKTLTVELKAPKNKHHQYKKIDSDFISYFRLQILKVVKATLDFNSDNIYPRCIYRDLFDYSVIGMKLSQMFYQTTDKFERQFNLLINEQSLAKLEENKTSYLIFIWARENTNTQREMSVANWIKQLEIFNDNSLDDWKITPKQFGSDLKKVAPVLREFGINCESLGKRGSFIKWKITTAEKIDIQANFFEKPVGF